MDELRTRFQTILDLLKEHYGWSLINDNESFIEIVMEKIMKTNPNEIPRDTSIQASIIYAYNEHIFDILLNKNPNAHLKENIDQRNQAAVEIRSMVYRMARRRVDSHIEAEEIAQTVLIRLIENPLAIRVPGALSAWIMWQVRDLISRGHNYAITSSERIVDENILVELTEHLESNMIVDDVFSIVNEILPPLQAIIIRMSIFDEMSIRDIANALNMKPSQVSVEKSRGLKSLRGSRKLQDLLGL